MSSENTVGPNQHRIWMNRIQSGEEAAWAEVYEYYHPSIFRFCAGYVKSQEEAEDLAQEVFIRIKERADQFIKGRSLRSWLYGISRNLCLDYIKKKKMPLWQDCLSSSFNREEVIDVTRSPMSKIAKKEEVNSLNQALASLDEEQRSGLLLKHVEGLSRAEVAEILQVDEVRVKNILYAAMKALREKC